MISIAKTADYEDIILAEQTAQYYDTFKTSLIATLINAPVLIIVLWPDINHKTAITWLITIAILTIFRSINLYQYQKSDRLQQNAAYWYHRFLVGSALASIMWGLSAVLLFPETDHVRQVFLAFVLGGMAAGAVSNLAYIRLPFYLYCSMTLIPLQIHFLYIESELGNVMSFMLILYMVMLFIAANRTYISNRKSIFLHIDNNTAHQAKLNSENRYKILLETATDAFFLYGTEGRILDVNQKSCELLGYSHDEILTKTLRDFKINYNPEDFPKLRALLKKEKTVQYESLYRRKDGSTVPVEINVGLININEEECFSVLVRDITDRKKAEETLLAAKQEAERANAAKSEFLSHMSHELRTPLNAILGFGQMFALDKEELTESQEANIKEILDAGYHLLSLINDILDLAKIETGKLTISMEQIFLDDIMAQSIPIVKEAAKTKNITITDNLSHKGYTVYADYTRLKQVMLNLLSNAVKYNRDQGMVSIYGEIKDDKRLRISIKDTGKGLSQKELAKLFTPFERLNTTHNIEGTGIGLVITKHLTELMNGKIGVESTTGVGSVFWVELSLPVKYNEQGHKI